VADRMADNVDIADTLEHVAELLETQGANVFRVGSYRTAADSLRHLDQPASHIYRREGQEGLEQIPGVGAKLSGAIREILETGRLGLEQKLEAERQPQDVLVRVPGVGKELAQRIHNDLGIESLAELERAAHDGRLEALEGIGERRAQGIRDVLAGMLSRTAARRARTRQEARDRAERSLPAAVSERPPVDLLLDVDQEYREKAEAGKLRTIAPRRFNPEGQAWLPIMKGRRDGWKYTALFSNTHRAHELNKTHDWVVIYTSRDGDAERQSTVVTGAAGSLRGKRVVRGREKDCRAYYRQER